MAYLQHHGIKGQKWGVRRYRNKDGSLTPEGRKRYRSDYDHIRNLQVASKTSATMLRAPVLDDYNRKYAAKQADAALKLLMKQIGERGISEIEKDVIEEGKAYAEKCKREAETVNAMLDLSIDDNYLFLTNPQNRYDSAYDRYLKEHLIKR